MLELSFDNKAKLHKIYYDQAFVAVAPALLL